MKHLYVNSRLHAICLSARLEPRPWRFTLGEPWLLVTPTRLRLLTILLGLRDPRVERLVQLACRYGENPERFCLPIGVDAPETTPDGHPFALCPKCDHVHYPHPLDADKPCPECEVDQRLLDRDLVSPVTLADRAADRAARAHIQEEHPDSFYKGELAPNWRINARRRLERDWVAAVQRIGLGVGYRQVAEEFACSVGLVHKRVQEHRHWENN